MTNLLPLNYMESTMTFSNEKAPLVVVTCLKLKTLPDLEMIRETLLFLQKRHPFLRAKIVFHGKKMEFDIQEECPELELRHSICSNPSERNEMLEKELNEYFDPGRGGLMRCRVLEEKEGSGGEVLLVFHHSIIDGISAGLILHEFLSYCGGKQLPAPISGKRLREKREKQKLPNKFRGFSFYKKLALFAGRQFKDELLFQFRNSKIPKPAAGSENKILSVLFTEKETEQITSFSKKSGIGINSLVSAAILKVTYENLYDRSKEHRLRSVVFASLRPFSDPRIKPTELGNYTSMLRFTLPISKTSEVRDLAKVIHSDVSKSGKRGDVFMFNYMSSQMVRMMFKLKSMRISTTALSYIGKLDLKKNYGDLELEEVHAFITNNFLGPQISAFGKILFNQLGLDFNYLSSETTEEVAGKIVTSVKSELLNISEPGTDL